MSDMLTPLTAISPIDGRYFEEVSVLSEYFSEYALIRYRVQVEVLYFLALADAGIFDLPETARPALLALFEQFGEADAREVKHIEQTTRHDVKAVEYFVKQRLDGLGLSAYREWVHFALTSQDINNTAIPLLWKKSYRRAILACLPAAHRCAGTQSRALDRYTHAGAYTRTACIAYPPG